MREHRRYNSIVRMGHKDTIGVVNIGDYITITEKIDGANAQFALDHESPDGLYIGSRNIKLSAEENLNGFYQYVTNHISKRAMQHGYIYYGEWLTQHKCVYKPEAYKKFYLFSVFNTATGKYLPDTIVKYEAQMLGLPTPEYFYEGSTFHMNI